jgi:uncharacterized protein YlxW (UPF0749 family)
VVVPRRPSLALTAVVGLLGFLLVTAAFQTRRERVAGAPRRTQLVKLIERRRSAVGDLDKAVAALRSQVTRARTRADRAGAANRTETERLATLARQAGTVAFRGRGLEVRLADSGRRPPSPEEAGAYRIHDTDLQLVANALFTAGAEAVAINDSRLVATTPIRAAGDTIVVNFRPLTPPYRVVAIGASQSRFEDADIARRFKRWTKLFGLGFHVEAKGGLTVPPFTGRLTISDASPVEPA